MPPKMDGSDPDPEDGAEAAASEEPRPPTINGVDGAPVNGVAQGGRSTLGYVVYAGQNWTFFIDHSCQARPIY